MSRCPALARSSPYSILVTTYGMSNAAFEGAPAHRIDLIGPTPEKMPTRSASVIS